MICRETLGPTIHLDLWPSLPPETLLQTNFFMETGFLKGSGTFQYDKESCHTAKLAQEWFEPHIGRNKVLTWPQKLLISQSSWKNKSDYHYHSNLKDLIQTSDVTAHRHYCECLCEWLQKFVGR